MEKIEYIIKTMESIVYDMEQLMRAMEESISSKVSEKI